MAQAARLIPDSIVSTKHAALPPSPRPGFDAGEGDEGEKLGHPVDPARVFRRLVRSRWWILGAFVLGAAIGLPVAKFVLKRDYRATAMLRYEGVPEIEGLQQAGTEEADLGSKLQSIFVDDVIGEVKTRLEMEEPTYVVGALITAESDPAQVVRISASATEPDRAAEFANTVVAVFLEHQVGTQRQRIQDAITSLDERMGSSNQTLSAARQSYDTFRERHGIADLTTEQEAAIERAAELRAQRDLKESEIGALEARLEQLRRELRNTPRTTVQSTTVMASAETQELRRLEAELAQTRANLSDEHPRVQALQQQISTLRQRIQSSGMDKQRTTQSSANSRYQALEANISEAQADLQAARQRLESLTTLAQEAQEKVEEFSSIEGEASGLLAEVRVNEQMVNELQTQKARLEGALTDPAHGFQMMDEASPPEYAEPSKKKYLVAAGFPAAFVFLTLLVLLWVELRGMPIKTTNEAAFWGKGPVVGASVWPRVMQAIDDLIADMDDFIPDATGEMLVVGATEEANELAQQFAGRLNSDWYDTTLVGSMFDDNGTPSLPPGSIEPEDSGRPTAMVPFKPHALAQAHRAHHIDMQSPMQMKVGIWEGDLSGPALRRAARLADRVCVVVKAQDTSAFELKKVTTRLGREHGIGYILVNIDEPYASLPDRVGPVEHFWASTRDA